MTFSGVQFQINASTFDLGPSYLRSSTCISGFGSRDGLGEYPTLFFTIVSRIAGFWIVGTVFLQNVYTTFNLGNNSVGFASLA